MNKRIVILMLVLVLYLVPISYAPGFIGSITPNHTQYSISEDPTWLSGWDYRKNITLNQVVSGASPSTNGTNYPVKFNIEWGVGSDSGSTIYLNEHGQADFDDVRFTGDNGLDLLDYWLRDPLPTDDVTVWVEVQDDLVVAAGASTVNIYIYYGNDAVSTTSNGTLVFPYFDDFENNNLDKWDMTTNVEIKADEVLNGDYSAGAISSSSAELLRVNTTTFTTPVAIHISVFNDQVFRGAHIRTIYTGEGIGSWSRTGYESGTSKLYYYTSGYSAYSGSDDDITDDTWFDYEFRIDMEYGNTLGTRPYHDTGNSFNLNYDGEQPFSVSYANIIAVQLLTQNNYQAWFDDFFIRPTAYNTEPSVDTFGSEETAPPYVPEWQTVEEISGVFIYIAIDLTAVNWILIFAGLVMVPLSTLYLVKGGRDEMSLDKILFFMLLFFCGWALVIGGIFG